MQNARVDVEIILGKVRDILVEIKGMGEQCRHDGVRAPVSADQAERHILARLLEVGVMMMAYFFAESGEADIGQDTVFGGEVYNRKQRIAKIYQSIFGPVRYRQWKYAKPGGTLWPLDQKLNLPQRQASYFVQEILTGWAAEMPFESAATWFQKLFKQRFSTRTIGEFVAEAVVHDSSFTEHRPEVVELPPPPETETIQAVSFDGAGVPMRPAGRLADTGCKREALVGVVYEAAPLEREARHLATALIDGRYNKKREQEEDQGDPVEDDPPGKVDLNTYYRASLENKVQVVEDLAANARTRQRPGQKQVVLLDGAHRLWDLANTNFQHADAKILDIIHVVGYLELAAAALVQQKQQRYTWLIAHLTVVLEGKTPFLIQLFEHHLQEGNLSASAAEDLQTVITYLDNHLPYMHYDEYLRHGYPVGTGVVESACKQLVRQRLDQAGARWLLPHAEAILKLRAMQRSKDDTPFFQWHQNQEFIRIHTPQAS